MVIANLIETAREEGRFIELSGDARKGSGYPACRLHLDTERLFQRVEGFGGALTEAAAIALAALSVEKRSEVLRSYFSRDSGIGYTLARTHLNSCDFSADNWACVETPDESLAAFSMKRPDQYLVPLIHDAAAALAQPLKLLVSPWSPPAWMKDNACMNYGGKLLERYYSLWAKYMIRFLTELDARGIPTWAVSIQNEPEARQTWDSCLWTAQEEAIFAINHLGPALAGYALKTGAKPHLLIWDHNRDRLWERVSESMSVKGASAHIDGAAFHWYSGDQYENVAKVAAAYPDKILLFSEGCIEGGPRDGAWFSGERYAHNIINDLNHGCTGWIDWNIALDMQGGPNHVGNYCDAPVLVDDKAGEPRYQSSYFYIGHFSRFIRPGARRAALSVDSFMTPATVDGRMGNMMEFCAFKNEDESWVIVALNRTEADMVYEIAAGAAQVKLRCPPRGIQTVICRI